MKQLFSVLFFLLFSAGWSPAQEAASSSGGYIFTDEIVIPSTPVKDQYRTSTCWSFGALAMLEAEMLRLKKPETDLSEMFIVFHTYNRKAEKFVRMHGKTNFGSGGAFHDVLNVIRDYGIVPEEVYRGIQYGEEKHIHGEMDDLLLEAVESVVKNTSGKLSPVWRDAVECTLNTYLGQIPEKFEYQGKSWSPQSFWRDYTGLDPDDYVEITSFTHHPYYSKFILEIPDNWSWDEMYNVPLDELTEIIEYSLQKGHTVAWAADNSDKGFQTGTKGIAMVLDSAMAITPEARQQAFDNYETTDDHGMLIAGLAKDQNGQSWYKVKNSWGDYNSLNGWFYTSRAYVMYKTTDIMVHKDGIPPHIRKKLGI